ncbi:MAG: hypothetical protein AAGU12_03570 [Clostridiales bacterium]
MMTNKKVAYAFVFFLLAAGTSLATHNQSRALAAMPQPANPYLLQDFQLAEPMLAAEPETSDGAKHEELGWLRAEAEENGIRLTVEGAGENRLLPYPETGSPGRDIFPWVVLPWQLTFSPDGNYLLLTTMEGYPDQYADYFRLWVLDLVGHEQASCGGNSIVRAWWLDNQTIAYWDFSDELLSQGQLYLWKLPGYSE